MGPQIHGALGNEQVGLLDNPILYLAPVKNHVLILPNYFNKNTDTFIMLQAINIKLSTMKAQLSLVVRFPLFEELPPTCI